MILDNRKAVPDIIVSREGVPNNIFYNINHNNQLPPAPAPRKISSPKRMAKKARESPKPQYVTGNNNGSPLHVPHNGNVYAERDPRCVVPLKASRKPLRSPGNPTGSHPGSPLHRIKRDKCIPSTCSIDRYQLNQLSHDGSGNKTGTSECGSPKRLNLDRQEYPKMKDVPSRVFDFSSGEFSDSLTDISTKTPIDTRHSSPQHHAMSTTYTKVGSPVASPRRSIPQGCEASWQIRTPNRLQNGDLWNDRPTRHNETSRDSLEDNHWNWNHCNWDDSSGGSWDIETDRSEEDNGKIFASDLQTTKLRRPLHQSPSGSYSDTLSDDLTSDSDEIKLLTEDELSFSAKHPALSSKMVVIKCKDSNYLTRILVNKKGIHGVKVVGRLGVGGAAKGGAMNVEEAEAQCRDHDHAASCLSQPTDNEFEHEAADYQWLLDYEYRESYSKDSLGSTRDAPGRVSVLQTPDHKPEFCYETISLNLDANLAQIDMDDFRSEDINQLLTLPNICSEYQDELGLSVDGSTSAYMDHPLTGSVSGQHKYFLKQHDTAHQSDPLRKSYGDSELGGDEHEEYSGVSGELSFYQSGPLFSPLKEPPQIPPSFSVDSLDNDSIHDDLILTCQANKDNYTIAFEGSYIQMSENSDYHQTGGSDTTGSGTWSTDRLEGRSPAPDMTHSDQPYTTWSRVSRRSSHSQSCEQNSTPVRHVNSPVPRRERHRPQYLQEPRKNEDDTKSSSMPNLMRRSLMRRSLEASAHCVKVYDLQNSLRSSQLCSSRSTDSSNFSLVRLFMKQKSLSKDGTSLSSSCTDPSQEGACSSSENQSAVNDSDWPMNSQSENDMDGSTSPIPGMVYQQMRYMDKHKKTHSPNIMSVHDDRSTDNITLAINNNNNSTNIDNITNHLNNTMDNVSFDDSLKELNSCSKPPMTSPIREEPEGMDISMDNRRQLLAPVNTDPNILLLKNAKLSNKDTTSTGIRVLSSKNSFNSFVSDKNDDKEQDGTRTRQDSGNSSSGYTSSKGSTEKIRRSLQSDRIKYLQEKPKPKPRSLKQFTDQALQTSNLKVSAGMNTSSLLEKKDVYVYYPNYALPDLSFLQDKKYKVDARIFLVPQKYNPSANDKTSIAASKTRRPFSMNDVSKIKQNLSRIQDWESLNCLLPKDVKDILEDDTACMETHKPSFCNPSRTKAASSESKNWSSSVNSTQPSSGYRGSSTLLNDFDDERLKEKALPKGVLRKCTSLRNKQADAKVLSREDVMKRRSLPEMDECQQPPQPTERACRIKEAGFGRLRSKTLDMISLKATRGDASRCRQEAIRRSTDFLHGPDSGLGSIKKSPSFVNEDIQPMIYDVHDKKTLVISVHTAVEKLVAHFKLGTSRERIRTSTNLAEAAQLALDKLCPAMYALLSDGMLPSINSLFGKINNTVWKMIEATSQLGPSTKALNDLVMTLNSEECLSEGPLKFNAFIFGLLNLRSVDAWLSYLRTRETTLHKHYHPDSFLYLSNTAMRGLYDDLIHALKPLALLPLQLDLLFEYKTLHASLLKMEERLLPCDKDTLFDHLLVAKETKELRNAATQQDRVCAIMKALSGPEMRQSRSQSPRPRSCCDEQLEQHVHTNIQKRWSGVQLGSKLLTAIDKLMLDDSSHSIDNPRGSNNDADISELSATDKDTENEKGFQALLRSSGKEGNESEGQRFRRLQLKWEHMAICTPRKDQSDDKSPSEKSVSPGCVSRSRIPRPVTSPQAVTSKPFEAPKARKCVVPKATPRKSLKDHTVRTEPLSGARSKLGHRLPAGATVSNRASSVPGRGVERGTSGTRLVQTLHHRLATDNGHLSFNRGELLTVVIEVDDKYLLCCQHDRKGLVPKSAVIPIHH